MIDRYRDHAANERTYLAWVRTAIAVMALGFLLEKFELFLAALTHPATAENVRLHPGIEVQAVSAGLVTLGIVVMLAATVRYLQIRAGINAETPAKFGGTILNIVVTVALVLFGFYLLLYLTRIV